MKSKLEHDVAAVGLRGLHAHAKDLGDFLGSVAGLRECLELGDSADHGAALFNLEVDGFRYTRIGNPTNAVLEKRVAALEGGIEALSVAIFPTLSAMAARGDMDGLRKNFSLGLRAIFFLTMRFDFGSEPEDDLFVELFFLVAIRSHRAFPL